MEQMSTFEKLVAHFGTQRDLAKALGISPQSINKWKQQIPAERVLDVERLCDSAVTRYEMRPDVFGRPEEAAA
jgi:DNA-binding transcriptional regulator YdaS (Cro superfamily)